MLVDEVDIVVEGGHGGKGRVSFVGRAGGPDGGDGGRGGSIYIKTTSDLYALNRFASNPYCKAEDGVGGMHNNMFGQNGKDLTIIMPVGTVLIDLDTKEEFELDKLNMEVLIARGGLGGKGNVNFKSSTNTTPRYAQPGLPGQKKSLKVKLKLIADFGLIGLPNSGKSSLLNEITNASAKIGAYPFTTLEPNLGMLNGKVIADIPGLIEGASEGKGLGHQFLKHIEKVPILLHCISSESEEPLGDYQVIHDELEKFNLRLLEKEEIILLTKSDLVDKKDLEKKIKDLKKTKKKVVPLSIHDWDSLQSLIKAIT